MTLLNGSDLNTQVLSDIYRFLDVQEKYGADAEVDIFGVKDEAIEMELDGKGITRYYARGILDHVYTTEADELTGYRDLNLPVFQGYLSRERTSFYYDADGVEVYLLQNNQSGDLLYTSNIHEVKVVLETLDFDFIEEAFKVTSGSVHRLYNHGEDRHFITGDENEVATLLEQGGYEYEGTL